MGKGKKTLIQQQQELIDGKGVHPMTATRKVMSENKTQISSFIDYLQKQTNSNMAKDLEEIETLFKDELKWPAKNSQYDVERLNILLKLFCFAKKYLTVATACDSEMAALVEGLHLLNQRRMLEHAGELIQNLSGEIRGKFRKCIPVEPFRWETLEKLGAVMKLWGRGEDITFFQANYNQYAKNFSQEFAARELILETAMGELLQELPELERLINFMLKNHALDTEHLPEFPVLEVPIITAFITRVDDTKNIRELLWLSNNALYRGNHHENMGLQQTKKIIDRSFRAPFEGFANAGLLEKHAFLRRLQSIGELLTGKNLSPYLYDLVADIDWRALVEIRDAITHQEKPIHKRGVLLLLEKLELLDGAFSDMDILFEKLSLLIQERVKKLPFVETIKHEQGGEIEEGNIRQFWDAVKNQNIDKNRQVASRTSQFLNEDAANKFIALLRKNCNDASIISQWENIFKGQEIDKKEKADLFKGLSNYFPKSGENTSASMQELAREAMGSSKQNKKSEEQRIADRDSRAEQAKNRREEKEAANALKHLAEIRKIFIKPDGEKIELLSYSEQVDYAIEALKNIHGFIVAEKDISKFLNNNNIGVVDLQQLWDTIVTNPKLSAAIEYNASQLLSHLEIIVNSKHDIHANAIPSFAKFIDEKYEQQVRVLRNYLEHGCPMLDSRNANILNESLKIPTFKQQTIPLNIINLVKELLPLLNKLKIKLLISEINIKSLMVDGNMVANKSDMGEKIVYEFCLAAKNNDVDKLNKLFEEHPYHNIDVAYKQGYTPLHYALYEGRSSMDKRVALNAAKALVLNGATIDITTAKKMPLEYLNDEDAIHFLEEVKEEVKKEAQEEVKKEAQVVVSLAEEADISQTNSSSLIFSNATQASTTLDHATIANFATNVSNIIITNTSAHSSVANTTEKDTSKNLPQTGGTSVSGYMPYSLSTNFAHAAQNMGNAARQIANPLLFRKRMARGAREISQFIANASSAGIVDGLQQLARSGCSVDGTVRIGSFRAHSKLTATMI